MVEHHLDMVVVGGSIPLVPTIPRMLMPFVTLPDGNKIAFESETTPRSIAKDISSSLAKTIVYALIDGQARDYDFKIVDDVSLELVRVSDPRSLEVIRHSCAHLMAHAIKRLFPSCQITIGPVIENGFYYDIDCEQTLTEQDLEKIEREMSRISKENHQLVRSEMSQKDALAFYEVSKEPYKQEIIKDIPEGETLSFYTQGDFIDLCRGPHVSRTGMIQWFKLLKVSGAYWRGDSSNKMLQRIYGTAWLTKEDLDRYLKHLAEAEKRDHRRMMQKMDLGHISDLAPGMVFWHEDGQILYREIQRYISQCFENNGYHMVATPQLVDSSLWEASGHLSKFADNMFTVEDGDRHMVVKPMNCPCHVEIFKHRLRSYRELPIRMAEYGSCHRNEPSGALHGLMRLRNFVQDDGHIFCRNHQIESEVSDFIKQLQIIYKAFGFNELRVVLSTRPEMRVGDDALWDRAEATLARVLDALKLDWTYQPGEGAFYGPKVEFHITDCLDRRWQCGTVQLDFATAGRLGASYINEKSEQEEPVLIHRATLGSIERFIGILLEHYDQGLPLWLAPKQVMLLGISEKHSQSVNEIEEKLKKQGIRAHKDLRNEKIGYKIREHTMARVPFLVIIGDHEVETQTLAVRPLRGDSRSDVCVESFVAELSEQIKSKQ